MCDATTNTDQKPLTGLCTIGEKKRKKKLKQTEEKILSHLDTGRHSAKFYSLTCYFSAVYIIHCHKTSPVSVSHLLLELFVISLVFRDEFLLLLSLYVQFRSCFLLDFKNCFYVSCFTFSQIDLHLENKQGLTIQNSSSSNIFHILHGCK